MYGLGSTTAVLAMSGSGLSDVSIAITEIRSPLSFDLGVEPNQPETVSEMPPRLSHPASDRMQAKQKTPRNTADFIEPGFLQ
jgi:hypothetical protein